MAESFRNPKQDEPFVNNQGRQTDNAFRFLTRVADFLKGLVALRLPVYADKSDVEAKVPNPIPNSIVYISDQGLAVYNGSIWVLAADGTTPIV